VKYAVARDRLVRSTPPVHFVAAVRNLPQRREALSSIIYVVVIIQIEKIALGARNPVIMTPT